MAAFERFIRIIISYVKFSFFGCHEIKARISRKYFIYDYVYEFGRNRGRNTSRGKGCNVVRV